MAAGAAALAAIWIDPPYSHIRPCARYGLAVFYCHHRAVAGEASGGSFGGVVHSVIEPVIDLPHDLVGIGMFTARILLGLLGMTPLAVLRRDHH